MRVVIDGLPIRGMSVGIVVEHLLRGFEELDAGDELHLVLGPQADIAVPDSVIVHRTEVGRVRMAQRLVAQSVVVPRLCRQVKADVMLGVTPATTVTPLPCPRAIIAYDMRHELRPEQFPTRYRLMRTASYDIGYFQADAIACISGRTKRDLLALHPRLARHLVEVTYLGGDHVRQWPPASAGAPYAIAFGQYANKNVDLVVECWGLLAQQGETLPLVLTGLSPEAQAQVSSRASQLGVSELITPLPWLPIAELRQRFVAASLVVYPSDFEGFGLPAVEAMQLGIPVVISPEETLLEVTAGHATVMDGPGPDALARAVVVARQRDAADLKAAQVHGETFTWVNTARQMRALLGRAIDAGGAVSKG
jgi:glycosyltransferase involved in cell wall biosynthesis